MDPAYLTVLEVAEELGITKGGVYKLIERGKLKAIRRTERGIRVSRLALDAYQRRIQAGERDTPTADGPADLAELREQFEHETGHSPLEWERRWKADTLEDSPENMRLTIRALALRAAEHTPDTDRRPGLVQTRRQLA